MCASECPTARRLRRDSLDTFQDSARCSVENGHRHLFEPLLNRALSGFVQKVYPPTRGP